MSLPLVTIAALVMGLDYSIGLLFPDWGAIASLNRVLFLGIIIYDVITKPSKYNGAGTVLVACIIIFFACLPFIVFVKPGLSGPRGPFNELIGLLGAFAYLLFFYVNCHETKIGSRICVVLFICSLIMTVYLLGIAVSVLGEPELAWRGAVQFTRGSGEFDPNIVMLYLIPCFAFGSLLALHSRFFSGSFMDIVVVVAVSLSLYAVLQLNSRSGTIVLGITLCLPMVFRVFLSPGRRKFTRFKSISLVVLILSIIIYLQVKYGIFNTILAVYGETHLLTDTSFAYRRTAYSYLIGEFSNFPNFLGDIEGYARYWSILGIKINPHCSLVDYYIKGGFIYLILYLYLYTAAIINCIRDVLRNQNTERRAISASLLTFLIGFIPMLMTLSLEDAKMPWGVMGCALSFAVHRSRNRLTGNMKPEFRTGAAGLP